MSNFDPVVTLARRFTIEWLNLADPAVPPTIMTPDYRVHIGTAELDSLPVYSDGTLGQLRQFPGLGLTVHELVTDGEQLALVFTEHGVSRKHDDRPAAWRGIALFRIEDGLLAENWTQEDYYSRRRQLAAGSADVIPPPAVSPWTTTPRRPDRAAESAAHAWLAAPSYEQVIIDDDGPLVVGPGHVEVLRLFSADDTVAFAADLSGPYLGGLDDVDHVDGDVRLGVCGVLKIDGDHVVAGRLVTDRLGLRRTLLNY